MNDVSAQDSCTITPLNDDTLIASFKAIVDEIKNTTVAIQCDCANANGTELSPIRWFNPDGRRIFPKGHRKHESGTPYYRKGFNSIIIIPTFNEFYYGTYICGIGGKFQPNVSINLTLNGKHSYVGICCSYVSICV